MWYIHEGRPTCGYIVPQVVSEVTHTLWRGSIYASREFHMVQLYDQNARMNRIGGGFRLQTKHRGRRPNRGCKQGRTEEQQYEQWDRSRIAGKDPCGRSRR